jgi:membrane protease YdiL (CAAX protease family)
VAVWKSGAEQHSQVVRFSVLRVRDEANALLGLKPGATGIGWPTERCYVHAGQESWTRCLMTGTGMFGERPIAAGTVVDVRPPWWAAILVLLAVAGLQAITVPLIIAIGYSHGGAAGVWEGQAHTRLVYGVAKNAVVIITLWVALRLGRNSIAATLRFRKTSAASVALGALMMVALAPWAAWIADRLSQPLAGNNTPESRVVVLQCVWCASSAFLSSVAEELLFRGYILRALSRRWGLLGGIGSAVLFGAYHLGGPPCSVLVSVLFGAVASYTVVTSRSILPAIVGHSLWTALSLVTELRVIQVGANGAGLAASTTIMALCGVELFRRSQRPASETGSD